jgi:ABC-type branched-subunit amino acid transport system substrate-binding protein
VGDTLRIGRGLALLAAVALLAAGCGSRVGGGDTTVAAPAGEESRRSGDEGGGGPKQGGPPADPDAPCGPGDGSGATAPGVTNDSITIGTIQDIGGPRPGLFQGNRDAMVAFVAYCNELGGINGRELVLEEFDSELSKSREATLQACEAGVLALVGGASALDGGGANASVNEPVCAGIPDIAGFTAEPQHAGAINLVQPLPNPPDQLQVGPQRYILDKFPKAAKNAAMLFIDAGVSKFNAEKRIKGYEDIGFEFVYESPIAINELNWGPHVEQFRSKDVGYFNVVAELADLYHLEQELKAQGVDVAVPEHDQSGYDEGLIEAGGDATEGTYIVATTVPFEEAKTSPEMQRYLYWLEQTDAKKGPTALGVQSWSAGLLFATAAKALGSDVTREGLLEQLHGIKEWDGHGIHAPSNPGDNGVTECFVYLKIKGGKFTREFPDEGFACDPKNVVKITGDFPKGAGR